MPFYTSSSSEVEFGPLGTSASDSDQEAPDALPRQPVVAVARDGAVKRIAGAAALATLLGGAAMLGGMPVHDTSVLDTEGLISESHFTQSCSWKCNAQFWGKGTDEDHSSYATCCQGCAGGMCNFPCTDACRQNREKGLKQCSPGDVACEETAGTEHGHCCSRCPGKVCVAKASQDIGSTSAADAASPDAASPEAASPEATPTCGGTAMGAACQFPFTYNDLKYTACTSEDSAELWCRTGSANLWGNCNCPATTAVAA